MRFLKSLFLAYIVTLAIVYYRPPVTPQSTSKKVTKEQRFKSAQNLPSKRNKEKQLYQMRAQNLKIQPLPSSHSSQKYKHLEEQAETQLFKEAAEAMKEMDAQAMRTMGKR